MRVGAWIWWLIGGSILGGRDRRLLRAAARCAGPASRFRDPVKLCRASLAPALAARAPRQGLMTTHRRTRPQLLSEARCSQSAMLPAPGSRALAARRCSMPEGNRQSGNMISKWGGPMD
jgi:hypothetical protein